MSNRKKVEAILVILIVVVVAVATVLIQRPGEQSLLTHSEDDFAAYPNFYSSNVSIEAREDKEAYLRVNVIYQGIPDDINFWSTYELWNVSPEIFELYYQPENQTAMDQFILERNGGMAHSTAQRAYDYMDNEYPLEPGTYMFIHYFEIYGESEDIIAESLTLQVSVVYL